MTESAAVIGAAIIAALVAIGIGLLQVLALKQQNRIAAFERRFAAFIQVQDALQNASVAKSRPDIADILRLNRALQECWFLFPKSLSARLRIVRDQVIKMGVTYHEIWDDAGNPLGASNETLKQFHEAQGAAVSEWERLRDTFRPHMNLDF